MTVTEALDAMLALYAAPRRLDTGRDRRGCRWTAGCARERWS
ncbi:hypothetical protein PMNALOAF_4115 [Methylobacterium adhaesivum]|nr:hypothetical protein PMNALOAF_4115 [Methylobacterium adhaesivum]